MNAIIHCHRCKSRTSMLTNGSGHHIEVLNWECECPPIVYVSEAVQLSVGVKEKLKANVTPRHCVDCGDGPLDHPKRKRCNPCGVADNRKRSREYYHRASDRVNARRRKRAA